MGGVAPDWNAILTWLEQRFDRIEAKGETIMLTLADIQAAVAAEQTVEASVITLLQTLAADLKTALANSDTAAMQAIVSQIETNTQALSAAVTANTPATTAP